MSKIAVYTSLFGCYDVLREPVFKDTNFFCFTDKKNKIKTWNYIENESENHIKSARYFKLHPHIFLKDFDYFIWQDACLVLKEDPIKLIEQLEGASLGIFLHAELQTIQDEVELICKLEKAPPQKVLNQFNQYEKSGFPVNSDVYETTIMVVKNDEITKNLFNLWWQEIEKYTYRDQLSLSYLLWKENIFCKHLKPGNIYFNPYFRHFRHRSEIFII